MGRLAELVRGIELALATHLGAWAEEVSAAMDTLIDQVAYLTTVSSTFSQAFLTQATWFVDSATGNDANDGATALTALQTIAELNRRTNGRVFAPTVAAVTVTIASGNYLADAELVWNAVGSGGTWLPVTISGTMTPVAGLAGNIGAYQPWVAYATRGSITDGAKNFTAGVQKRIRITSGAAIGGVSSIGSLGGGVTVANVGQFYNALGLSGTLVNPANGDGYIVEDFATRIRGYSISAKNCKIILRDVSIESAAGANVATGESVAGQTLQVIVFGCQHNIVGILHQVTGLQTVRSTSIVGAGLLQTALADQTWAGTNVLGTQPLTHTLGSTIQASNTMHDGNGVGSPGLRITNNSQVVDGSGFRFFGGIGNGSGGFMANCTGSRWEIENALWGAAGNTATTAVAASNGSSISYDTKPTCTGNTPGVSDVVIAGVAHAWAAVPFLAAGPDNACINVRH